MNSKTVKLQHRTYLGADKKPETSEMLSQMKNWNNTFQTEYRDPDGSIAMTVIGSGFAKELLEDCDSWFKTIYTIYETSTVPLTQEEITKIVKSLLYHINSKQIQDDLKDAHRCITNELFTPSVMLLQKVAEGMVKEFYKKKIGTEPPSGYESTWGAMMKKLKPILDKEEDPVLCLLDYRKFDRNYTMHPGSRFESSEAIEMLYKVKELVEEIGKKL